MSTQLVFPTAFESSDGGEAVFEVRTTVRDIVAMHDGGFLEVGNIRPDHARVTTSKGERFRRVSDRQKNWTEQLSRGGGVLGNLTWNADPDLNDIEWDPDEGLRISGRSGGNPRLKTPDSATRHRAILDAAKAPMPTIDLDRPVSVRVWVVPASADRPGDLTEAAVFDSYNQDGKPVNATVAKGAFQRTPLDQLVRRLVDSSPHLGLDNVETIRTSVSRESNKLVAYNTLHTAFKDGYTRDLDQDGQVDLELQWLLRFWDCLVRAVPEVGRVGLSQRKEYRRESIAGSATLIHAYVALAAEWRENGLDPHLLGALRELVVTLDQDGLRRLPSPVTGQLEPVHRAGETVGFFSPDNPRWSKVGVVVPKSQKDGSTAAEVRNAFQTRVAATKVLSEVLVPAKRASKQELVDRLCALMGIPSMPLGVGGTIPARLFEALASHTGVEPGAMPVVGRRVAEKAGLTWGTTSDSTQSPSGGGSTVTAGGLAVLVEALERLAKTSTS